MAESRDGSPPALSRRAVSISHFFRVPEDPGASCAPVYVCCLGGLASHKRRHNTVLPRHLYLHEVHQDPIVLVTT